MLSFKISSKYNIKGITFGKYHNHVLNNQYDLGEITLKNIKNVYQKSKKEIQEKIIKRENLQGNYTISEELLLMDKEYQQINHNMQQLKELFPQHYHAKGIYLEELKNTVKKEPAYNDNDIFN